MILNILIADAPHAIDVPDEIVQGATPVFDKIDADMDKGWQMSRSWVEKLSLLNRCQVVADKLVTAMETDNKQLTVMMAAYILNRLPNVDVVDIDINGEMMETLITTKPGGAVIDLSR